MKTVIIDGQGGKIGCELIARLRKITADADITAVGTNSAATSAMLKSGATRAATGENAIKVACRTADIIAGPVGIVVADSLLGEMTPAAAEAVGASKAHKVLVPVSKCNISIAGLSSGTASAVLDDAARLITEFAQKG